MASYLMGLTMRLPSAPIPFHWTMVTASLQPTLITCCALHKTPSVKRTEIVLLDGDTAIVVMLQKTAQAAIYGLQTRGQISQYTAPYAAYKSNGQSFYAKRVVAIDKKIASSHSYRRRARWPVREEAITH